MHSRTVRWVLVKHSAVCLLTYCHKTINVKKINGCQTRTQNRCSLTNENNERACSFSNACTDNK